MRQQAEIARRLLEAGKVGGGGVDAGRIRTRSARRRTPFDRCNAAVESAILFTSCDGDQLDDFVDHLVRRHALRMRLV